MIQIQILLSVNQWLFVWLFVFQPFKRKPHKMVKHIQTIRRQIADELFECVWPFLGVGT